MKLKIVLAVLLAIGLGISAMSKAHADGGSPAGHITHVVIIVQENRTPDNLFQGVPGADIQNYGYDSNGVRHNLVSTTLAAYGCCGHEHDDFTIDFNNGAMNGWDLDDAGQESCHPQQPPFCSFAYVGDGSNSPYLAMAESWAFGDRMFGQRFPSMPAHQEFVSGTATGVCDPCDPGSTPTPHIIGYNPTGPTNGSTCGAPAGTEAVTVDPENVNDPSPNPYTCFERPVISDELDTAGVSWTYYQDDKSLSIWKALDAINHVYFGADKANIVTPVYQILTDITNNNLAHVSWVIPKFSFSDHPGNPADGSGPAWVAAIVNEIGENPTYWGNTAIFIVWDDWGGWYDHVVPPTYNSTSLGFRVPLIVISPYAKTAYVSHHQHEFGSILHFVEEVWSLPSLGVDDARADDLNDMFNFASPAATFSPIPAPTWTPH